MDENKTNINTNSIVLSHVDKFPECSQSKVNIPHSTTSHYNHQDLNNNSQNIENNQNNNNNNNNNQMNQYYPTIETEGINAIQQMEQYEMNQMNQMNYSQQMNYQYENNNSNEMNQNGQYIQQQNIQNVQNNQNNQNVENIEKFNETEFFNTFENITEKDILDYKKMLELKNTEDKYLTEPSTIIYAETESNIKNDLVVKYGGVYSNLIDLKFFAPPNSIAGMQYEVVNKLGNGMFGHVYKCVEHGMFGHVYKSVEHGIKEEKESVKRFVALKVLKDDNGFFRQGLVELVNLMVLKKYKTKIYKTVKEDRIKLEMDKLESGYQILTNDCNREIFKKIWRKKFIEKKEMEKQQKIKQKMEQNEIERMRKENEENKRRILLKEEREEKNQNNQNTNMKNTAIPIIPLHQTNQTVETSETTKVRSPRSKIIQNERKQFEEEFDKEFQKEIEAFDKQIEENLEKAIQNQLEKWKEEEKRLEEERKRGDSILDLLNYFIYKNHICIVTELLGQTLYDRIIQRGRQPFAIQEVRKYTTTLLKTLEILEEASMIHCDIKPENILFTPSGDIKLIDYGSSCFTNGKIYTYIQSRHYRAPEVIIGNSYGPPIDIWSVGCIVMELIIGIPLFPGSSEYNQLEKILDMLGPIPYELLLNAKKRDYFFKAKFPDNYNTPIMNGYQFGNTSYSSYQSYGYPYGQMYGINGIYGGYGNIHSVQQDVKPEFILKTRAEFRNHSNTPEEEDIQYFNVKTLDQIMQVVVLKDTENGNVLEVSESQDLRLNYLQFVNGLLEYDPNQRANATKALQHPFLKGLPYDPNYNTKSLPRPPQKIIKQMTVEEVKSYFMVYEYNDKELSINEYYIAFMKAFQQGQMLNVKSMNPYQYEPTTPICMLLENEKYKIESQEKQLTNLYSVQNTEKLSAKSSPSNRCEKCEQNFMDKQKEKSKQEIKTKIQEEEDEQKKKREQQRKEEEELEKKRIQEELEEQQNNLMNSDIENDANESNQINSNGNQISMTPTILNIAPTNVIQPSKSTLNNNLSSRQSLMNNNQTKIPQIQLIPTKMSQPPIHQQMNNMNFTHVSNQTYQPNIYNNTVSMNQSQKMDSSQFMTPSLQQQSFSQFQENGINTSSLNKSLPTNKNPLQQQSMKLSMNSSMKYNNQNNQMNYQNQSYNPQQYQIKTSFNSQNDYHQMQPNQNYYQPNVSPENQNSYNSPSFIPPHLNSQN